MKNNPKTNLHSPCHIGSGIAVKHPADCHSPLQQSHGSAKTGDCWKRLPDLGNWRKRIRHYPGAGITDAQTLCVWQQ